MLAAIDQFRDYLQVARRLSSHTLKSYSEDLLQFLNFLTGDDFSCAGWEEVDHRLVRGFLAHLRQATVEDSVDERWVRTVVYRGGGQELSLSYDLWRTEPGERRIDGAPYRPPSLVSPIAVQGAGGRLALGGARLQTDPQPVWLIAQELDPATRAWVAVNPQDRPTPLRLETPNGVVSASRFGMGRLEWRAPVGGRQELLVESLEDPIGLVVPEGVPIRILKE